MGAPPPAAEAVNAEVGGIGRSVCLLAGVVVDSVDWENGDEKSEGEVLREAGGEKKETMESQVNGIVGELFLEIDFREEWVRSR